MFDLHDFGALSQKYADELKKRRERHEYWQSTAKPLILRVLSDVCSKLTGLDCHAKCNIPIKNFEAVYLKLHDIGSGILLDTPSSTRAYIWISGGLIYSQNPDGRVLTWFELPYVRGIEAKPDPHHYRDDCEPNELSEKQIHDDVATFLKFITRDVASKQSAQRKIGFLPTSSQVIVQPEQ